MQGKQEGEMGFQGITADQLAKDRKAIARLVRSKDAQSLMKLLSQSGDVQQAAKSAAQGNSEVLMSMLQQLLSTQQGAQLIDRIENQAKQAGLEKP